MSRKTPLPDPNLVKEFNRIKDSQRKAMRSQVARLTLGASVIRVFAEGTKKPLMEALERIPYDDLRHLKGQSGFKEWFEKELERLARVVKKHNPSSSRLGLGYKWGHTGKVLCLNLKAMVLESRYFSDDEADRIAPWLYSPIDNIIIRRLTKLGWKPQFSRIKEIDSAAKFYAVQDALGSAAEKVGVPRIWFDYNWGDRQ